MYKGKSFLAIIPARGGSKGLHRKNIRLLRGKPLLWYSVSVALKVPLIDRVVVSSDDDEILRKGKNVGAEVLKRPLTLANDKARTEAALLHAVRAYEERGEKFDFVITLEPTHPFRRAETLKQAIQRVVDGKYDSLTTLTPDSTDFWQAKKGTFKRLFPNAPRRRQDREPLYKENSLIYITAVDVLKKANFVLGKKTAFLLTDEDESLDIHTARDLSLADHFMKELKHAS